MAPQAKSAAGFPRKLGIAVLAAVLLIPAINLVVDPTEVFGTGLLPHRFQVNDRYRKFEYLLTECGDCTGFLLGSSRMGYTDPALFDQLLTRGRAYNMNISSANAWDYLAFARFLEARGIRPELLVVQLDLTEEFGDRARYQQHPAVSGESRFRFFFENLFSLQYRSLFGKVWFNLQGRDSSGFDWATGQRSRVDAEQKLAADAEVYVRDQPEFQVAAESLRPDPALVADGIDRSLAAMRDLVALCGKTGTRLVVVVTPHNQHYLDRYRVAELERLLRGLAALTPFWNFAGYSSVTTDDRNYYETSHHRPYVAAWVAQRILDGGRASVPADFGRYVTRSNVEGEIAALRAEFEARKRAGKRAP
jgi:hypothetical protein